MTFTSLGEVANIVIANLRDRRMTRSSPGPMAKECGIRDAKFVDHRSYVRVRKTLPPEPKTPSVDDILAAMCARLAKAYDYDYAAPKDTTLRTSPRYSRGPNQRKMLSPIMDRAKIAVLGHPTVPGKRLARMTGISDTTIYEAKRQLRDEGKLK